MVQLKYNKNIVSKRAKKSDVRDGRRKNTEKNFKKIERNFEIGIDLFIEVYYNKYTEVVESGLKC